MTERDTIATGREALARIRQSGRRSWDDWIAVAHALQIGRTAALKMAGTNRAVGLKYNRAVVAWLAANGLSDVSTSERYRALLVLEKLPAISAWRDALPEAKRHRFNSPSASWHAWRRSCTDQAKVAASRDHIAERIAAVAAKARNGVAVHWPQDHLRRAHQAMLESHSSDLLILARLALQGAIRSESDLIALLDQPRAAWGPKQKPPTPILMPA